MKTRKATCSICGKQFQAVESAGTFGDSEAEGLLLNGEPVCFDCLDEAKPITK